MNAKKKSAKKPSAGNSPTTEGEVPITASPSVAPSAGKGPLHLSIPPILLEGDPDPAAYPKAAPPAFESTKAAVPEQVKGLAGNDSELLSLGELRLLARDAYTLFAQWDLAESELNRARGRAADGMIVLRVHRRSVEGPVVVEIPVLGGERHEFIPVPYAAMPYACQLGYRSAEGRQWFSLAQSETVVTAPDPQAYRPGSTPLKMGRWSALEDFTFQATELSVSFAGHLASPSPAAHVPAVAPGAVDHWASGPTTSAGFAHLAAATPPASPSSADLVHLAGAPLNPGTAPSAGVPVSELGRIAVFEIPSSPVVLPPELRRGFWFAVNAEVVVYGSTEPDAAVTLAGRAVKLRPDGSFSFRFSLPDGQFQIPITAASADGVERRGAELRLSRTTGLSGDVGAHPQEQSLRPPAE